MYLRQFFIFIAILCQNIYAFKLDKNGLTLIKDVSSNTGRQQLNNLVNSWQKFSSNNEGKNPSGQIKKLSKRPTAIQLELQKNEQELMEQKLNEDIRIDQQTKNNDSEIQENSDDRDQEQMSSFLETNEQKSGSKIKTKASKFKLLTRQFIQNDNYDYIDRESIGAKFVSVETVDHLSKDAQDDYKDNFKKKEKYKLDFIDGQPYQAPEFISEKFPKQNTKIQMSYNDPIFQKSVMFKNEEDMETPMIFINKEKKHTEYPGTQQQITPTLPPYFNHPPYFEGFIQNKLGSLNPMQQQQGYQDMMQLNQIMSQNQNFQGFQNPMLPSLQQLQGMVQQMIQQQLHQQQQVKQPGVEQLLQKLLESIEDKKQQELNEKQQKTADAILNKLTYLEDFIDENLQDNQTDKSDDELFEQLDNEINTALDEDDEDNNEKIKISKMKKKDKQLFHKAKKSLTKFKKPKNPLEDLLSSLQPKSNGSSDLNINKLINQIQNKVVNDVQSQLRFQQIPQFPSLEQQIMGPSFNQQLNNLQMIDSDGNIIKPYSSVSQMQVKPYEPKIYFDN